MSKNGEDSDLKTIEITLPQKIIDIIKEEQGDPTEYIKNLIKKDCKSFSTSPKSTVKDEDGKTSLKILESENLEIAINFLKNYRKKEWIEYILETRGEKIVRKEAERIAGQNPEDWAKFSKKLF